MFEKRHLSRKFVLCLVVTLMIACLAVIGCSGSQQSSAGSAPASSLAAESPAQPDYIGAWDFVEFEYDSKKYNADDLDAMRKKGAEFFININEDKSYELCLVDERSVSKGTWSSSEDGTLVLKGDNSSTFAMVVDGDEAKIGTTALKYAGPAKSIPKKIAASSSSTSAESESAQNDADETNADANSGEVSPDLKEALDSYEAFMDEYVAFMQKYKESGNATSMLNDYVQFMQKYSEFANKIGKMDTSSMSTADYQYYIEVTSRVSKKLLDVSL